MAETFQFDLVSPERRLSSIGATAVTIPGAEGDMTVMAGHAPLITTLRPGVMRVETVEGVLEFVVTGGFAEVVADAVTVLAERSLARGDVTQDVIDAWVAEAASAHRTARGRGDEAPHGLADDAAKLLADMVAMGGHIGLNPNVPNL